MLPEFLDGVPALLTKEERALVAGDLHLGRELKLEKEGIHFANASRKAGEELLRIYGRHHARSIILLGDVKESITYPPTDEYRAISDFFMQLKEIEIGITKGNHDAHLGLIMERLGMRVSIKKEILLERGAFMHGNAMPSAEAMKKEYLVIGHGHTAVAGSNGKEKAWLVASPGKDIGKAYGRYRKGIRLIVAPSFSGIITGSAITPESGGFLPLFRNKVFDFKSAEVYSTSRERLGKVSEIEG
jgi:metallophosphoesterase superfamily enzyme